MESMINNGAVFWDQNPCGGQWSDYRQFTEWYLKTESYLLEIISSISFDGKILIDVGCGQGVICNIVAQRNAWVIGIDMSYNSLLVAKRGSLESGTQERTFFIQADAENLPFEDSIVDIVISIGVLHHTPCIQNGINEIKRVLKPLGDIAIMLYRRGNPKWCLAKNIRNISKIIKKHSRKERISNIYATAPMGTAIQELLDVPIMHAYSNKESQRLFSSFNNITIKNYQAGFSRLLDFLPMLMVFKPIFKWIDDSMQDQWGFYQVIKAKK
jgi:ubiquinone/menaquinone biosynthesis C-methylase UbiE